MAGKFLALDIGNTNITLGVFQGSNLEATWRLNTLPHRLLDEYVLLIRSLLPMKNVTPEDIDSAAICSVVPTLTPVFEEMCRSYLDVEPIVVATGTKTGVRILYDNPRDVGADRVVDAAAAFQLYGGPVISVDFGTATVFDAVSREGEYLGGAVAPGLYVSADALVNNTSQLRRVELVTPSSAIGRNSIASLQSGLIFGHVGLVEYLVQRFKEELGQDAHVIATGGLAPLIARETSVFKEVNQDLTLIGLRMIYDLNARE